MNAVATAEAFAAPEAEISFEANQDPTKLFSIRGRLGVLKYAAHSVLLYLGFGIAAGAAAISIAGPGILSGNIESLSPWMGLIALLVLPFMFLLLCMAIKRLHDINMSGWFVLLAIIPVVGTLFSFFFMLKPGRSELNRFGSQSPTKGWEKIVGVLGLVIAVSLSVYTLFDQATAIMSL